MSGFILGQTRSLIYSIDVIGACAIYFAPKMRAATRIRERTSHISSEILQPRRQQPRQYPVPIQRAFKLISNISSIVLPEDDPTYEDEEDPSVVLEVARTMCASFRLARTDILVPFRVSKKRPATLVMIRTWTNRAETTHRPS